jgi:hypothetical protein
MHKDLVEMPAVPAVQSPTEDLFGPVIHCYTRAQAIADGVLVDVSESATDAGFEWPVALTRAVWEDCVAWSYADSVTQVRQDEAQRLWDLLFRTWIVIRVGYDDRGTLTYAFHRIPRDGHSSQALCTELKVIASIGDGGEPVLTILLPHED